MDTKRVSTESSPIGDAASGRHDAKQKLGDRRVDHQSPGQPEYRCAWYPKQVNKI